MTIRFKNSEYQIVIDLTGPDGNAYFLMELASKYAKLQGMESATRLEMIEEMKSGDYENLLLVFDRYFGDIVVLER
jgi:hypothetical protein